MSDLTKEIAKTVVRIKSEMRKASAKPKKDNSQADLFEDEGGRRYSRAYRRSKEKELQAKRKSGGPKVMGKAQFASRSEAGRYAANMRWKGQGQASSASAGSKAPKQKYDFSPQDYKMVRDAMPQLSAADAKKLTQYLLDNNAFGDTSEMSNQEMSNEFALYLDDALGSGSSEPKGIKVDFRPEDPEPTRNDVGDIKKASLFVRRLKRDLTIASEGFGRDRDAVPEYMNRLKGAKAVFEAKTKEEGARIVREFFDKAEKYQKEYQQDKARLSQGANNNVRQNLLGRMETNDKFSLSYFQQGDGAQDCWEMRFDQSINTYPEMQKAKSFSSRSEAGRYAANQRWKGQGKKTAQAKERLSATGKYKITPAIGKVIDQGFITLSSKRKVTVTAVPGKEGYYTVDLPSHKAEFYLPTAIQKNSDGSPATHVGLSVKPKWSPNESVIRGASIAETEEDMARIINDEIGLISRLDQKNGYEPPIDYPGKPLYRVAIHTTASTDVHIEKMGSRGWESQMVESVADEDGNEYDEGLEGRTVTKFQTRLKAKAAAEKFNVDPNVAWS